MKYLTMTSPSYAPLTDHMIKTSGVRFDEWEIMHEPQRSSGNFGESWFNEICCKRPARILELLREGHDVFVVDGDVTFFDPITEIEIHPKASVQAQIDPDSGLCCGAILYKSNYRVIEFMEVVLQNCIASGSAHNDQVITNAVLQQFPQVRPRLAAFNTIHSFATLVEPRLWMGDDFDIPTDCQAFHANFAIGIDNKIKLLQYARMQWTKNRN